MRLAPTEFFLVEIAPVGVTGASKYGIRRAERSNLSSFSYSLRTLPPEMGGQIAGILN